MDLEFGTIRSIITTYAKSDVVRTLKHFKVRVKVRNAQEEMTEFIRFTAEIAQFRADGVLVIGEKEDPSLKPAFIIDYPRDYKDGAYFVIKNYCIMI